MGWLPVPRDDDIDLKAKSGRSLARYFPEMVAVLARLPQTCFVLDGELTIVTNGEFSFDALLARLHPAETRIRLLSTETPAIFILFDICSMHPARA
jgi:ATP-dependent DNA ligase